MLLSWKPPPTSDTSCPPATYTITITAANVLPGPVVVNTTDSANIKTVIAEFAQGMEYSFTVAGIDAGGRVGEFSGPSYIILDSKYAQTFTTKGEISCNTPLQVRIDLQGRNEYIQEDWLPYYRTMAERKVMAESVAGNIGGS